MEEEVEETREMRNRKHIISVNTMLGVEYVVRIRETRTEKSEIYP